MNDHEGHELHKKHEAWDEGALPLEQIHARFAGHWVLVEITSRDVRAVPTDGVVLRVGTRRAVTERLRELLQKSAFHGSPYSPYYCFSAGATIPLAKAMDDPMLSTMIEDQFKAISEEMRAGRKR